MNHIDINIPQDCCGCGACVAVCPSGCIQMRIDAEGFLYPEVDATHCTDCGLCLKTCPWQTVRDFEGRVIPPQVYAAWHLDQDIRRKSSSGGVFTALAEEILSRGGAIVGAAFDENMVVRHMLVENTNGLEPLRGSKYVQSEISSELYSQIRNLLNQGRYLLFSGTPCQVAGLRNFLGQDYETLYCCDFLCHGVPSPGWFKTYLTSIRKGSLSVSSFAFRDKKTGWKRSGVRKIWSDGSFSFDGMYADPFMVSFLRNYCLRECCYVCKFTTSVRQGHITIADYWGVATKYPEYDRDNKGTSLLLINTAKGQGLLRQCKQRIFLGQGDLEHAIAGNAVLSRSASRPPQRDVFFRDMLSSSVSELRCKYELYPPPKRPLWRRAFGFIMRHLKRTCAPR